MTSPDRRIGAARRARRVTQPRKAALLRRLSRIGGQVRGLAGMVEQDRYCIDILTQIAAAQSALDAVSMALLEDHTRGCVRSAVRAGRGDEAMEELLSVVRRFVR